VLVYEGSVIAKELITGAEVIIPAGQYTIVIQNQAPSQPDDIGNMEKTGKEGDAQTAEGEEESEDEDQDMADTKETLRDEIKDAVYDIKVDAQNARDVVEDTKEVDSVTGRTLRDVHGNLVRVEQYVTRPQPDTIQFINITKRSNYKYVGRMNVAATGSRLDSFEVKSRFNLEMPEKISDWFGFFKDIDDSADEFHPQEVELKMRTKVGADIDEIILSSVWEGTDEDGDMSDPVMTYKSAINGQWNVMIEDADEYSAGDPRHNIYGDDTAEGEGIAWGSEENLELWAISPKILLYKDRNNNGQWDATETANADYMWVRSGMEGWVINNEGDIVGVDMFEDGDMNPFELIKNIAFEVSAVVRYGYDIIDDPNYILNKDPDTLAEDWDDLPVNQELALAGFNKAKGFFSNNWDLVVTPDFVIPILEQIAKGATSSI
ncbi:hypothetical protein ACFLTD_02565, partial [Elusimicrobiota bacterium]